jgi:hypothetical protein
MKVSEVLKRFDEEIKYVKIVIECSEEAAKSILPVLAHMKRNGDAGHSYSIVSDPEAGGTKYGTKKFGFDGDGWDKIKSIKLDGQEYKEVK